MRSEALLDRQERGELSQFEAAEALGISERSFRRWRDRLRDEITGATGPDGMLLLDGVPLGIGDDFTQADIDAGEVVYVHNGNPWQSADAFSFLVRDQHGVDSGPASFGFAIVADGVQVGSEGSDSLFGGPDDDLIGLGGDDVMYGGGGADTFYFVAGDQNAAIMDFEIGIDTVIMIHQANDFGELQGFMHQSGNDTVIAFGNGDTLTLAYTNVSHLSADDFDIFGV